MSANMSSDQLTMPDVEANNSHSFLTNDTVDHFSWSGVTVTVKDRETKQKKNILENSSGYVNKGKELCL